MRKFFWIISLAIGCGSTAVSQAASEGDSVVLVYNTHVPESKTIAEHYADRRNVPKSQIFGFDLPTSNDMPRKQFRDQLQKPLLKKLDSLKLWRFGEGEIRGTNGQPMRVEKVVQSKIRYAIMCYGVPYSIASDSSLKEAVEENMRPEFRRNEAAVDSELAWLPLIKQNPPLAGFLPNLQFTTTNEWSLHPTNGVLLVTRLDGPSAQIANALVDKAIAAETDGLWGRAYIDVRNTTDPGMKLGDDWMRGAAEVCRHFGFETVVDEGGGTFPPGFPMSHIGIYAGWYAENVNGPFALPNVEFMPGAFAYHLHSFSAAALRTTNRNWAGPLLAKGATITMGSVAEPYLSGTPDVGVFLARLTFYGFDFGAAAYASQNVLSWQTTVVGDPLYRPFKKPNPKLHFELEAKHSKLIEWSHLRVVDLNLVRKTPPAEVINYLESIPTTKESAVLEEKLGDLCVTEGKPSSAIQAYDRALGFYPSPQQRIRLRLTLGEKLMAANRDIEAYVNYERLLDESPNYPDKVSVLQKMVALSQKLGRKDDVKKFEAQIRALQPQ